MDLFYAPNSGVIQLTLYDLPCLAVRKFQVIIFYSLNEHSMRLLELDIQEWDKSRMM